MKKAVLAILLFASVAALVSCGGSADAGWRQSDCSAYVTLGQYKGVSYVTVPPAPVTDEDVGERIDALLAAASTVETLSSGEFQTGDEIKLDFSGTNGADPEPEVKFSGYITVLGDPGFFDAFDGGLGVLVGQPIRDRIETDLTYRADLGEDKAGRTLHFVITVSSVKRYHNAELNEDFLKTQGDFESVDAFRQFVRETLEAKNQSDSVKAQTGQVWRKVIAAAQFTRLPEGAAAEYEKFFEDFYADGAASISMDKRDFMGLYYGVDEKDVEADSEKLVMQDLVILRIAALENLSVTSQEIDSYLSSLPEQTRSRVNGIFGRELVKRSLLGAKVTDLLMKNAVPVAPQAPPAPTLPAVEPVQTSEAPAQTQEQPQTQD